MDQATYDALTRRLFTQNLFSIKLGLDRVQAAVRAAGTPQNAFDVVIVAGTNGKGTTSALMASLLQRAGLRVGLFTSPHLVDVRERFRVDGVPLPRAQVAQTLKAVLAWFAGADPADPSIEEGRRLATQWGWEGEPAIDEEALTFFELTTLAGLCLFAQSGVDVVILEVGVGGRLDAVNAVEPLVSAITRVDMDHQKYLGDTLGEIAFEKAGVMRSGRPVVVAPQHPEAMASIRQHAQRLRAGLIEVKGAQAPSGASSWLSGPFADNAAVAARTARAVLEARSMAPLAPEVEAQVLAAARWPGRRDAWLGKDGPWLFDVAHNPAGMKSLGAFLKAQTSRPPVGVMGVMADKDVDGMIETLVGWPQTQWVLTRAQTPRAMAADELARRFDAAGLKVAVVAEAVPEAVKAARALTSQQVLVCGSVYLLGEVLTALDIDETFFALRQQGR